MSVSASRRTWEEASSPAAIRLAREYEQAWRGSRHRSRRPDLHEFLESAGASADGAGARLALLRADLSLRWEAGERVGARWYLDRYAGLSEDTIVALVYEEFCLLEDDGEPGDPAEFLARFPNVAPALRRVLDIHGLVGSGSTQARAAWLAPGTGSGEHACAFPEVGQTIAGFSLVEELGRGAFARVFLARERELADRPVALKVTRRGSREPQTLARLQHTHIVPVHSHRSDKATGLHLLCMPYFGRTTLGQVLADSRLQAARSGAGLVESLDRLEPFEGAAGESSGRAALCRRSYDRAVAWWGARMAEALEHAHERGVLHRDIKPSNVLVTSDGMPMLLDFNLAREPLADDGQAADAAPGGTVDYMAPEHLRALADGDPEGLDHRSDIYSLGVVLFEALTGCRPFPAPRGGGSLVKALHRVADARCALRPRPRSIEPEVPPALEAVVRRCLEPEPAYRYRTAGELAADLRAVADDLPLAFAREPLTSRVGGWLRRKSRKLLVAAALASALFVATLTILAAWLGLSLIAADDTKLLSSKYNEALGSLDARHYEKAKLQFDAFTGLAAHFDKLDPRHYHPRERSLTGNIRAIAERLQGLREVPDIDALKALARDKGELAGRYAQVHAEADALLRAADRLRFRLLLAPKDIPAISVELRRAFEPFFVLQSSDWTKLEHKLGMLDRTRATELKDEVNELLFLWIKVIDDFLTDAIPAPENADKADQERRLVAFALETCDHALVFAEPKAPWRALRARLARPRGEDPQDPAPARAVPSFEGEPRDISSERSALASFQWALLGFRTGRMARSIDWMSHAVHLRGDNYWYQFFLAYVLDVAEIPDEALEHYSIAAALQPGSPWVRFSRARLYRSKGQWRSAFDDLDVALGALKDQPEARGILLERGFLHQTMGDFAKAVREYDLVIAQDATDGVGRAARLNRANLSAESGNMERARKEYDALLAEDVLDMPVLHSRAILELRTGQASFANHDLTALLNMGRAIHLKDRVDYLAGRAQARLLLGRASDALADAVEARHLHPCPSHDRLAQRTFLAARRYNLLQFDRPESLTLLPVRGPRLDAELRAAAAELGPIAAGRNEAAFVAGLTRSVILAGLGDSRSALAAANRAVSISPFAVETRLVRARVLAFAGDRRGAAAELQRALAIRPDDSRLLELRGDLKLAEGDPRGALADFNRALSDGPRDGIHLGKASALFALGEYHAALDEWSLALRRDPELPEAFLGRARTYLQLFQWDLGLADLEQAAAWAHADARIEAAVAANYLQCLPHRPERVPRLLVHLRRAAGDFWQSLDSRGNLAAALE